MRLPVEQYYELDPSMIKPLGGDRFQLAVPRIQLFNVWLEPLVVVQVTQAPGQVIIEVRIGVETTYIDLYTYAGLAVSAQRQRPGDQHEPQQPL